MHLRDKLSLHEITKRTGLSRNTVRKWLRSPKEVPVAVPVYSRRDATGKLGAFHGALEQALKVDSHRLKQNRRSAKDLFEHIKLILLNMCQRLMVGASSDLPCKWRSTLAR
jgi:transposase